MEIHNSEPQLLQLRYGKDPWKIGVVCILLNRTRRAQVDPIIDELFSDYPDAETMASARVADMRSLLHPLGFSKVRAERLVRFSEDLASGVPFHECYGVGKYATDSYRLFVQGDLDASPDDKELRRWLRWRLNT